MNIKKLWGSLVILFVAIFAFTACSSDDDDEKVGTFEYEISYSSFEGSFEDMQKVSDAFQQAFGVTSTPITLTGTQSECNRKAKECAMKAQAAFANEGGFGAVVEFTNTTTDEQILTFTITKADNVLKANQFRYYVVNNGHGVVLYNLKGYRVKMGIYANYNWDKYVFFDDVITEEEQFIDVNELIRSKGLDWAEHVHIWVFKAGIKHPICKLGYFRFQ